ncbi:hypothetical protein SAMN05216223_119130 [Actinacidiphila yanglinensis]|uniref:Uncharacterized protein n=1 Tax=Actinacidiphila yanglinensis TaxID=310779 RepID=A0A1H6DTR2_9ACTN|nr:hypothetical protein [Actinacidiphila yanglinensis]SEG88737.1 hypothetical protein SAMN05216223_119130 [Actinacidiphila yanglinensis]
MAAEPEPQPAPAADAVPEPAPYRPRRRGRTTLLIAAAAVLGVLAGGGLGYHIQQQRRPTPLPPLTGPVLAQPKGAGPAAPKLTADQDGGVVFRSDLLKLLVPTPKGDKEEERDWNSLLDYAEEYTQPAGIFTDLAGDSFQRSVEAAWTDKHHTYYQVALTQFRDDTYANAKQFFEDERNADNDVQGIGHRHDLTDVTHGTVWGSTRPHTEAGYLPDYQGRGIAQVGNIYVEVYVDSLHPVKAGTAQAILEKQLERL